MGLFNKEKEKFKPFVIYCDPIEYNGITVWYMQQPKNQYGSFCCNNDDWCYMITWPLFPSSKTVLAFEKDAKSVITDDPSNKLKLIQIGTFTGEWSNKTTNEITILTIPILTLVKSDDDYIKIDSLELCKKSFGDEIECKKFE